MSYSLGDWDRLVPRTEGLPRATYTVEVGPVQGLPSGSASQVPETVALFLRNAGFPFADARWISGGRLRLRYQALEGSPAYRSGVERRRAVEAALAQAARSLGPSVRFGDGSRPLSSRVRSAWPWVLGGAGLLLFGTLAFAAGTSAEGVRRERVRANRRRRRRR